MIYIKFLSHPVGYIAVNNQVKVIEFYAGYWLASFKPAFNHAAGTTTGTVLKNYLWMLERFFFDILDLLCGV